MINDKGIFIKNIYYMLTYAFQVLKQTNYENIASEDFENIENLFAAILSKGISQQLKQGLFRDYVTVNDELTVLRGKLDLQGTMKNIVQQKKKLACEFDEFSENNIYNQILKTTANKLIQSPNVSSEYKKELRKVMMFFGNVNEINTSAIRWSLLKYQRSNRTYEMLLNICYFVLKGLVQTTEEGSYHMIAFSDEHMERLYEHFILEYYRYHHPHLNASSRKIDWDLDEGNDEHRIKFLPEMKADITLEHGNKTLIIDAKYYGRSMQQHFDTTKLHSANLYQIFAYVKNLDAQNTENVSGMLLYAKTNESVLPDFDYLIGGNKISAKHLDLNTNFELIKEKLDLIAESLC